MRVPDPAANLRDALIDLGLFGAEVEVWDDKVTIWAGDAGRAAHTIADALREKTPGPCPTCQALRWGGDWTAPSPSTTFGGRLDLTVDRHMVKTVSRDGNARTIVPKCGKTLPKRTSHESISGQGATVWASRVTCPACLNPPKDPAP